MSVRLLRGHKETHLRQFNTGFVIIQHAHLVCKSVADDEAERIHGRRNEKVIGPDELLAEAEQARVDTCCDKDVRDDE